MEQEKSKAENKILGGELRIPFFTTNALTIIVVILIIIIICQYKYGLLVGGEKKEELSRKIKYNPIDVSDYTQQVPEQHN